MNFRCVEYTNIRGLSSDGTYEYVEYVRNIPWDIVGHYSFFPLLFLLKNNNNSNRQPLTLLFYYYLLFLFYSKSHMFCYFILNQINIFNNIIAILKEIGVVIYCLMILEVLRLISTLWHRNLRVLYSCCSPWGSVMEVLFFDFLSLGCLEVF